ncbi:hypothetical protein [Colwellia piezophila]|uniref:hypothetical protein n=1 Tax=Colwellia piezophila TaxID=211668 RepID=UPI000369C8FD|nr:hypothetical protein [Colwellia piezophila]
MKINFLKFSVVGLMLSVSSFANSGLINPSFEDGLTGWNVNSIGTSFGYGPQSALATDGSKSMRMYSVTSCANKGCGGFSFSSGDYIGLSQSLDFTGITEILFDGTLTGSGQSSYQSFIRAAAYIGSTLVWSETSLGQYLNIGIDTTLFSGLQVLEFRVEAIGAGVDSQSDHIYLDNIRTNEVIAVPDPATELLFVPALLGLMVLRRKAKNSIA